MTSNDFEMCTLVASHPHDRLLLTERGQLPRIAIRKHARFAEEIVEAIRRQWDADAIVHFRPALEGTSESWAVATLESVDSSFGLEWSKDETISDPILRDVLLQWNDFETGERPGSFARRAWLSELKAWAADHVHPLGARLTGNVRQYNASPTFALLRLETETTPLWFKATGDPNRHEFTVTRELALRAAEFLPRIIAFHDEWNGWLMLPAEGEPIDLCGKKEAWVSAAGSLARLQTRFLLKRGALGRIGCRDRSFEWARTQIDPFFERAKEWMGRQPAGTASQPLSAGQLRELNARAHELLTDLDTSGIGETLVHGDINAGNVMVSGEACVFLDWAEAWISHPFVSFEYLRELLRRTQPDREDWMEELYAAYVLPWSEFYEDTRIERALALSPAAAAIVYALVCAEGLAAEQSNQDRREAFLRSLIRRVDRETRGLKSEVAA